MVKRRKKHRIQQIDRQKISRESRRTRSAGPTNWRGWDVIWKDKVQVLCRVNDHSRPAICFHSYRLEDHSTHLHEHVAKQFNTWKSQQLNLDKVQMFDLFGRIISYYTFSRIQRAIDINEGHGTSVLQRCRSFIERTADAVLNTLLSFKAILLHESICKGILTSYILSIKSRSRDLCSLQYEHERKYKNSTLHLVDQYVSITICRCHRDEDIALPTGVQ